VWALTPLKRGRSPAPEGEPVGPVSHRTVKATLPYMPPSLQAMVRVQELCGARPSEICGMRPCDVEKRRDVWVYRPPTHKTMHKGNVRVIVMGPRAQRILAHRLAGLSDQERVFKPERGSQHGSEWTTSNYGQAIRYAIRAARKAGKTVPAWAPNQLRHACGTRVRRRFGPEAASVVLGHTAGRGARVTDVYTHTAIERELIAAAARVMRLIG
jgi:integrase